MLKDMTREDLMDLFGLEENDIGLEFADEQHEDGETWYEIAKGSILQMQAMLEKI